MCPVWAISSSSCFTWRHAAMIAEEKCESMCTGVTGVCGVTDKYLNFIEFRWISKCFPCSMWWRMWTDFLQASDSVDILSELSCSQHQSSRGKCEKLHWHSWNLMKHQSKETHQQFKWNKMKQIDMFLFSNFEAVRVKRIQAVGLHRYRCGCHRHQEVQSWIRLFCFLEFGRSANTHDHSCCRNDCNTW